MSAGAMEFLTCVIKVVAAEYRNRRRLFAAGCMNDRFK